ncbi:MAG: hypothetical protein WBP79_15750, partial [Candidatus Acidiferrales bacterium]
MNYRLSHVAVAMIAAASLIVSPVYAQTQGMQGQAQDSPQSQPASQPQAQPATAATSSLNVPKGPDYSKGKSFFPNFLSPFSPVRMAEPVLTNTPRLDQLIQNGKLMLSLDDAIAIALENNLDISVQRFTPWIAETQLLKAKAGGIPQSGSSQSVVLGSGPSASFDPVFTSSLNWARSSVPVNNPFISGTGTSTLTALTNYSANANFGYTQGFHTGTAVSIFFDNNRASSTSGANAFNPSVQSTMTFTISQPLLSGFGILPNTRFILEAKNTLKVAESVLAQQVIATITQVEIDYWELVYA